RHFANATRKCRKQVLRRISAPAGTERFRTMNRPGQHYLRRTVSRMFRKMPQPLLGQKRHVTTHDDVPFRLRAASLRFQQCGNNPAESTSPGPPLRNRGHTGCCMAPGRRDFFASLAPPPKNPTHAFHHRLRAKPPQSFVLTEGGAAPARHDVTRKYI